MAITYQSALHLSLPALAEVHTRAYGTNWASSPHKLAEIFRVQSIDLQLSLVAYDGRKPAGLALLGRRRAHGWLHDFAIVPAYRGAGLGTRLLTTATREAARHGVRDIELDVWERRADAIRLYGRAGFQHRRTYLVFEATGEQLGLGDHDLPPSWRVEPCAVEAIIPWYAAAAGEPEPAWDRRLPSLLTYGDARACQLFDERGAVMCLHFAARPADGRDPNRVRPMFAGLREDAHVDHLRALFAATAAAHFPDVGSTAFRLALEPEGSTFARLLQEAGVTVVGRALDMRLTIV
jgi:ribosomal protein S18 acetylase RimI-like enzyme